MRSFPSSLALVVVLVIAAALPRPAASEEPSPPPPLAIQITDRTGSAIPDATVEALDATIETSPKAQTTTNSAGKAVLRLDPGSYRIRVQAPGFVERIVPIAVEQPAALSLFLFPEATLAVRVVGPESTPLESARVCVTLRDASAFPEHALARHVLEEARVCGRTDAQGALVWPLPFGIYDVRVEADGLVPRVAVTALSRTTGEQRFVLENGGSIVGRLVNDEDRGISKAGVRLRHREREASSETTSDTEGKFLASGLAPGHWLVEVDPPGGATILRDGIEVTRGAAIDLGVLTARGGAAISGIVLDPDGAPVAAAKIRAHEANGIMRLLRRVKTDEQGRFRVPGFRDEEQKISLVVEPPAGLAPKIVEDLTPPVSSLQVRLSEAGRVCGVVRVARGALPETIRVGARCRPQAGARLFGDLLQVDTGEIDALTGRFCIDVVPAEEIELTARAPGYWAESASTSVESGHEAGPVELTLQRGLVVEGTVNDLEGEPLAEASVLTGGGTMVFTAADGEFRLDGLRPGMNHLTARRPGFASAERDVLLPLPEGERLVIELGRGGAVLGSVLHADDRPAEGVALRIDGQGSSATVTDADGRYRIDGVAAGEQVVVRGVEGGYDDFERRVVEIAEGATVTADFVIGSEMEGLVLRGGIPVPGAMITLGRPPDWSDLDGSHAVQRTFSDGAGQYRLAGVRPGWNTVTLRDGEQRIVLPTEIPAGQRPHVDFSLPDRLVRGSVLAADDDSPLGEAWVSSDLTGRPGAPGANSSSFYSSWDSSGEGIEYGVSGSTQVSTRSDSRGEFALYVESAGDASVRAFAPGYDMALLVVGRDSSEPLAFHLSRNVTVRLHLLDPAGRPAQEISVCVQSLDQSARTCSNGRVGPLEQSFKEGSYTILATAAGFGTAVDSRKLEPREDGQPVEVSLRLAPGAPALIRLVGRPGPDARVVSLIDAAGIDRTLLVKSRDRDPATGEARWPTWPLDAGTWQVTFDAGDGTPLHEEVTIVPGVEQEIVFP